MPNIKLFLNGIVALIALVLISLPSFAQQNLTQPRVSQHATVSQRVGLTDITIDYHRPGVSGRDIWGALVPFDQVWRAGANENTTISFSTVVSINGKDIPPGTYGLHIIPANDEWTIILSKDYKAWGSFFYDESHDQLRFTVKPETSDHQEWLIYSFEEITANSATLSLRWEKLRIPFSINVDVNKTVSENMQIELTNLAGFFWQGWNQASNFYLVNSLDLNQALSFADRSIQINKNVTNSYTKALILESLGRKDEATKLKQEAFINANENDVNALGYQFLFAGKIDEAIEIFKKNVELYPESWNVYDSLGEGYMNKGETKLAIQYYSKALEMAPEAQHSRITGVLNQLKTK